MHLAPDVTQEDLQMFLEEADEQLQLLDKDIATLQAQGNSADLLQETFRAAHNLKGSSAMVGHYRMSELAEAMECALDGLRKGTLTVNPQLIDSLRNSLGELKTLKEELIS